MVTLNFGLSSSTNLITRERRSVIEKYLDIKLNMENNILCGR